jgi:hypothetical protein
MRLVVTIIVLAVGVVVVGRNVKDRLLDREGDEFSRAFEATRNLARGDLPVYRPWPLAQQPTLPKRVADA